MSLRWAKQMGRRLQEWLERSVVGTRLQEWVWRTRHLYRPNWARGYLDTIDHPHRDQIVNAVLGFSPVDSLLEIGCASGANLICLRKAMPTTLLIGVDINRQAIATAKHYFDSHLDTATKLFVGRADRLLDMQDASVDIVLTDAVLMFIAPDRIHIVLAEMCRIARKGLVLNEYHRPGDSNGRFDGGRWVYDLVALIRLQRPKARIEARKSAFVGGGWDVYGNLIEVRL